MKGEMCVLVFVSECVCAVVLTLSCALSSSESLPDERRPAGRACVCYVSAEAAAAGLPPDDGASGPVPRRPAHGRGQPFNRWTSHSIRPYIHVGLGTGNTFCFRTVR